MLRHSVSVQVDCSVVLNKIDSWYDPSLFYYWKIRLAYRKFICVMSSFKSEWCYYINLIRIKWYSNIFFRKIIVVRSASFILLGFFGFRNLLGLLKEEAITVFCLILCSLRFLDSPIDFTLQLKQFHIIKKIILDHVNNWIFSKKCS